MSGWLRCARAAVGTRETVTPRRSATALTGSRGMRRRRGTAGHPRTLLPVRAIAEAVVQVAGAFAQFACRTPTDDGVRLDVAGHDCARRDHCAFADRDPSEDCRADRDPGPVLDDDR